MQPLFYKLMTISVHSAACLHTVIEDHQFSLVVAHPIPIHVGAVYTLGAFTLFTSCRETTLIFRRTFASPFDSSAAATATTLSLTVKDRKLRALILSFPSPPLLLTNTTPCHLSMSISWSALSTPSQLLPSHAYSSNLN